MCYILLDIPWLYDMNIMHDKQCNTYTFGIKRKLVVLTSKREKVVAKIEP
jgi:Zn-dependent protease with chaperone function